MRLNKARRCTGGLTHRDIVQNPAVIVIESDEEVGVHEEICAEADANIACLDLLFRITMTECCKELKSHLKKLKPLLTLTNQLCILPPLNLKEMPKGIYFKKITILYHTSNINKKVLLVHCNLKSLI